jgi:hypothetical protein
LQGTVEVQVTVDKGVVVDAEVKRGTVEVVPAKQDAAGGSEEKLLPYLSLPSLDNVKSWQFSPEERGTFLVTYVYRIEGTETPLPENPRVEVDLPRIVVTARPIRPSHSGS